jgi:hypothetical protein
MASDSRTLKLSILADVDELKKGLATANKEVETTADKIGAFGKKAALAFAAVGAAVGAFAISAVKAAGEDEKARKSLEQTIRSSTKATEEQIAGLDDYISKQSIATATTDDVLRPAFARLVRSTEDVTKAQDLLSLAQEISTATGKPLETVANALGKSFDGQNTALGKLGLGIDAATLKTMSHEQIMQQLKGTYNGFIANEATNAEFKFKQLTIALDETKEKIGVALLPIVKELADFFLETVVPNVQAFAAGLTGEDGVVAGITAATEGAYNFGQTLIDVITFVITIKEELLVLGGIIATVFVANKIVAFVSAIMTLVTAMKALRTAAAGAAIATAFATGGTSVALAGAALAGIAATYGLSQLAGGSDLPTISNAPKPNGGYTTGQGVTNITVNAIDGEGAARAVAGVLNQSAARSAGLLVGGTVGR